MFNNKEELFKEYPTLMNKIIVDLIKQGKALVESDDIENKYELINGLEFHFNGICYTVFMVEINGVKNFALPDEWNLEESAEQVFSTEKKNLMIYDVSEDFKIYIGISNETKGEVNDYLSGNKTWNDGYFFIYSSMIRKIDKYLKSLMNEYGCVLVEETDDILYDSYLSYLCSKSLDFYSTIE